MVKVCPVKFVIVNRRVLSTFDADMSPSLVAEAATAAPIADAGAALATVRLVRPSKMAAAATVEITFGAVRMSIGFLRHYVRPTGSGANPASSLKNVGE
jgi:hypothetical protein